MENNRGKNTKITKFKSNKNIKTFWKLKENKNPISWFYFGVSLTQIVLVTLIATMTFWVHPFWWNATLYNRPDLIAAFVFEAIVFFICVFQIWYLYKNKRITYLQIIYIVLSLFVIALNALAIVLIPLMVGLLIRQKVKKRLILKLTIFGVLSVFLFPVVAVSTLVLWGIATSQDKNDSKSYTISAKKAPNGNLIPTNKELNILTWNIGYGATPSDVGYFYDLNYKGESGPVGKAHNKDKTLHHLKGIEDFFKKVSKKGRTITGAIDVYNASKDDPVMTEHKLPKVDFGFVQEVDRDAIRSFRTNQPQRISNALGNYDSQFVNNFKVGQLPVPFMDPGGAVDAGLLTFSNYKIDQSKAKRISLNSVGSGLDGIFNLKRAIGYTEYVVASGKKLHLANIHLSAFPNDKAKRIKEYKVLANLIKEWNQNGDYIIIGGDWNTDITDSYYYEKAEDGSFNSKEESQKLKDENTFGLKGKTGLTSVVQPLGIYDISKMPEEFRKVIEEQKLKIGVDYNLDNPTMHSNAEKFIGIRRDGDYVPSVAIIDGFMTSSNIKINRTKTYQQGWNPNPWNNEQPYLFSDSDHNPVIMSFELVQ